MRSRVGERHPALSLTPCKNKNTLFWKSCSQESFFLKSLWAIWEPDSNRCAVENFLVMQRLMLRNGMIFEQKDNHSPMAKRQDYIDTCHKSFEMGVSSKDIQKARRMAKRIRTSVACARCGEEQMLRVSTMQALFIPRERLPGCRSIQRRQSKPTPSSLGKGS